MVRSQSAGKTPRKAAPKTKRFSVTVDAEDYAQLRAVAKGHRPQLTLQYVVNFAIQRFLHDAKDPQLLLDLGNPLPRGRDHGA